ncbi:MAG: YgcG family protein [Sedimentibacter sp.]
MKKNLLSLILALILIITGPLAYGQNFELPEPTKEFYVNDFADLIDDAAESNMININLNYENTEEKPQIVVATVENLQGLDESKYAVELFEKWKIGNKEYNNGLLVLLSLEERRIKIEVGYGLEGAITDSESGRILDDSLDYLSEGDYSTGLENIFYQLAVRVNEEYGYDNDVIFGNVEVDIPEERNSADVSALGKLILMIIIIIIINGFGGGGRRRRRGIFIPPVFFGPGGRGGGGFGGGGFGGGGSFGGGGRSGGGGAGRGF